MSERAEHVRAENNHIEDKHESKDFGENEIINQSDG